MGASSSPFYRLTDAELQTKRDKGLCYRCDGKYSVGHRFLNRELQVLVVRGEEVDGEKSGEPGGETWEDTLAEELVELSLNSVVGLTAPRTMKLKGRIKGTEVVILIDSGASHNFISTELVQSLDLGLDTTGGYGVVMGTGLTVKGEGVPRSGHIGAGR